jgi:hypothetical protein
METFCLSVFLHVDQKLTCGTRVLFPLLLSTQIESAELDIGTVTFGGRNSARRSSTPSTGGSPLQISGVHHLRRARRPPDSPCPIACAALTHTAFWWFSGGAAHMVVAELGLSQPTRYMPPAPTPTPIAGSHPLAPFIHQKRSRSSNSPLS